MINAFIALALVLGLTACTSGSMRVKEVFFYRVVNHTNANYFRLTVDAHTKLGVSELRAGWFPARSVDSLFGDVSSGSGVEDLKTRAEAEKLINRKLLEAMTNYVNEAVKPNPKFLEEYNRARMQVLLYPQISLDEDYKNYKLIDYNPLGGLLTEHADEKFVLVLSSNPDEVVGKIANFTETDETVLSIKNLSGTIVGGTSEEILSKQVKLESLQEEMAKVFDNIQGASSLSELSGLTNRIASILSHIKAIKP